jgi:RimJ/RimL family protein N-acetyltransferase
LELGFLITPSLWRQGYGTEVATALLDYAITHRGHSRVIATVDADHPASIGVLERAGMRRESERRDEQGVYLVYSMVRPDSALEPTRVTGYD